MTRSRPRLPPAVIGLVAVLQVGAGEGPEQTEASVEAGRRIYLSGLSAAGEPVEGRVVGDVTLRGAQVSCATCHRRSGFGTSEGGAFVPPIVAPWLLGAESPGRADLFSQLYQEIQSEPVRAKLRAQQLRPPYDEATLAVALREGRDPSGRALDPVMPLYRLDDADMAHLVAYLRTLGASDDPGVDASAIHFATVITPGVAADRRQAMLEVMRAYFEWRNSDTEGQLQRPGHSPWHRDDFYRSLRLWQLHVWELEGASDTWAGQLAERYRQQPVFALLSGLGAGDWRPIHHFCERQEIPCLFPNTESPVVLQTGAYSLYLSRGTAVEAEALGRHLQAANGGSRVLQVHRDHGASQIAARALRRYVEGDETIQLSSRPLGAEALAAEAWQRLIEVARPSVLVLWLADVDLEPLVRLADAAGVERIVLSYSLLGDSLPEVPAPLRDAVRLTYRYALPGHEVPRVYRVWGWMRSRKLERNHERLRLNTYFALSITDHAVAHLVESFSRDYFVESVEHEAENALNPGVFPHLSLGPGQRFASKGSYVVRLTDGGMEPVSGWIVP